jgi:hypothetical protein
MVTPVQTKWFPLIELNLKKEANYLLKHKENSYGLVSVLHVSEKTHSNGYWVFINGSSYQLKPSDQERYLVCGPILDEPKKIVPPEQPKNRSVLQDWVQELPFMQQSVLISAMRGPDGVIKNHPSKMLCRWLRRCIVISAFDKKALDNPYDLGGGSYTGPSIEDPTFFGHGPKDGPQTKWEHHMDGRVKEFLNSQDDLPHHFYLHIVHAIEILGYKHSNERIRNWWFKVYQTLAHDMHLHLETKEELDNRLNDCEASWRSDESRYKK